METRIYAAPAVKGLRVKLLLAAKFIDSSSDSHWLTVYPFAANH